MKKDKLPGIVTILVLTLITAFMWISFNVYRSYKLKPSEEVPEEILRELTPTLDAETISKIDARSYLNESLIPEVDSGPAGVSDGIEQ